jgi:hypothetical protein
MYDLAVLAGDGIEHAIAGLKRQIDPRRDARARRAARRKIRRSRLAILRVPVK